MGLLRDVRGIVKHLGDTLDCKQAVELVTEYLEGSMSEPEVKRFERHLRACSPCVTYVEQVKRTTDVLGHVHPERPAGATRDALLKAFRDYKRS